MLLTTPALGPLRIASPNDILRIGVVAACGFRYSPVFTLERPYYAAHPEDTVLSYHQKFSDFIKNPEYIVLVAVDQYDPIEVEKSKPFVTPGNETETPFPGQEVIVGVACWKLQPGSSRVGSFQNNTGSYPQLPENKIRDQNTAHVKRLDQAVHAAGHKYFQNISTMEMAVVHPAYWRRGHGSTLVRWGMKLANIDQVKQGVIAAKMGKDLYSRLGYIYLEVLYLNGDEQAPEGLTYAIMGYIPAKPRD